MMNKIKLLIASAHMAQAGSERWIYEVCRHLDRERFTITVLTDVVYLNPVSTVDQSNYYLQRIRDLGISVVPGIHYLKQWPEARNYVWRAHNLISRLSKRRISFVTSEGKRALQAADAICVMDAYLYEVIGADLEQYCPGKYFTVLHCHKLQFAYDLYRGYDKSRSYVFSYFCPKQIEDLASSGFNMEKLDLFYNPLLMSLADTPDEYQPIDSVDEPVVVGIFTRITPMKPLEPFVDAFALLRQAVGRRCVLHLYGAELNAEYTAQLRSYIQAAGLSIEDVRFMGHVQDIAATIRRDKVNLYWGIAFNTSFGYASIEIGAMGIPAFFMNWDLTTDYRAMLEQTDQVLHIHRSAKEFADDVAEYIKQPEKLRSFAAQQRQFLIERHEIKQGIPAFEKELEHFVAASKDKQAISGA